MMPYERFEAWQLCHRLVLLIYRITREFPAEERYGLLTAQARRAAFSPAANIAEGCVTRGSRELRRFLDISIGSLGELADIIRLSTDLEYIPPVNRPELIELHQRASQVTWALYASDGEASVSAASLYGVGLTISW